MEQLNNHRLEQRINDFKLTNLKNIKKVYGDIMSEIDKIEDVRYFNQS